METEAAQIEIWKKIIDVQQHFNDLGLRIRNFALVVTGAFLGLGGYAIKDGGFTGVNGHQISIAAVIIAASLVPLLAFYVMDRLWYHRLLDGAVSAGADAEKILNDLGLKVTLGQQISRASPFVLPLIKREVHSRHKMDGFYGLLALAIVILSFTLGVGVPPGKTNSSLPDAVLEAQALDDVAAKTICETHAQALLADSAKRLGSLVIDPVSGDRAVLIRGRWRLVPKC